MTLLDGWAGPGGWALASALLLTLPGCGDDAGSDTANDGGPASTGAASSTGGDGSTEQAATSGSDSGGTTGTSGMQPTRGSTTSEELQLCNGWQDSGDTPWLELYGPGNRPLVSGGMFAIECGGQGSWMFPIYPRMGGWDQQSTILYFDIEVVVEGFAGPSGSFFLDTDYFYDLECGGGGDTFDGGFAHSCIAVIPPDEIADLALLDGAPTEIHIEMSVAGGDPIVIDLVDMTLSAPPELVSEECFF